MAVGSRVAWRRPRRIALLTLVLSAAVLVGAHLAVEKAGAGYRGLLLPLDRIFDVACALGLVVLASGLGRSVLDHVRFSAGSALDRVLLATAVGVGIEGTAVLFLGSVSLLRPTALVALGLALVWIAAGSGGELLEDVGRVREELKGGLGPVGVVLLGAFAVFLLLQSGTPPGDWDVLTYHLDVPQEYLRRGKIFLPADNHHASFVGLAHMLYVPLLTVGAESAPAVLGAIFALLLALTLYAFGRRILDLTTGRLGAVLVWGSPAILLVAVTARVDVTMTWFLVLCHYGVLVALERREVNGWFWMAAVVGGLAVGIKLSAVAYLVGLAPVVAWVLVRASSWTRPSLLRLLGFGCVTALVAAPWLTKNAVFFGAPFYPFLTDLRLEPWLAEYVGTARVPPSVDADVFRIAWKTREPFSLPALFADPGSMTPEPEGAYYFGNFALLLLPLSILWSPRKMAALLLPAALYLGLVLYPDGYTNLRYLIPALVIGTLVASHVVARIGEAALSNRTLRRCFFAGLAALCLLPAGLAIHFQLAVMRPHDHWLGLTSEKAYLEDSNHRDVSSIARVRAGINERMPPDARIIMLFESRGLGFEPEVLQDNLSRNWPILGARRPWRDCLASTDATHVLVNYGHLTSLLGRGMEIETVNWQAFARFARQCLEREAWIEGAIVYRIVQKPRAVHRNPRRLAAIRAGR